MATMGASNGEDEDQQNVIREEVKLAINIAVEKFRQTEEQELAFPSSFTSSERAYVHRYCQNIGLSTKSRGKGTTRYVTVYKKSLNDTLVQTPLLLPRECLEFMSDFLRSYQVTNKERQEFTQGRVHKTNSLESNKYFGKEIKNICSSSPPVPPKAKSVNLSKSRHSLPVSKRRNEILDLIKRNQVCHIAGEPGCGKTSQIGQFLLEDCAEKELGCRVILLEPTWWSAVAVSERVAAERGEHVGQTVGYHLRLESRVSPKTSLMVCTMDVFLRVLARGHKVLKNLTHIIFDELVEIDKHTNFLFICLRDLLKSCTNLHLIFLSDSICVQMLHQYFGSCSFMFLTNVNHPVEVLFLDDIMSSPKYLNSGMKIAVKERSPQGKEQEEKQEIVASSSSDNRQQLPESNKRNVDNENSRQQIVQEAGDSVVPDCTHETKGVEKTDTQTETRKSFPEATLKSNQTPDDTDVFADNHDRMKSDLFMSSVNYENTNGHKADNKLHKDLNISLHKAFKEGQDCFDRILNLIFNRNMSIDHRHPNNGMTPLMVAAAQGNVGVVRQLIENGADYGARDLVKERDACSWARYFNHTAVVSLLGAYCNSYEGGRDNRSRQEDSKRRTELSKTISDDSLIDYGLILSVLGYICKNKGEGSVLIFLPSYDEIAKLREKLIEDMEYSKKNRYQIMVVHSLSAPGTVRKMFKISPPNSRKIILATGMAETRIPFDDVVYVIDTGKCKRKTQAPSATRGKNVWISKSSVLRRSAVAGRCSPGICFHLFSSSQFQKLKPSYKVDPLQTQIHDICLLARILAPVNMPISDFLAKASGFVPAAMVKDSVRLLQQISALDEAEELTELGKVLVELPVEPHLGKMIVFGLILKCLDPVVIIASAASVRDVFITPTTGTQRRAVMSSKCKFAGRTQSDHFVTLRAFQAWSRAKEEGRETSFCQQNSISQFAMESISSLRTQVVNHLRSLGFVRPRGPGDLKDLNMNSSRSQVIKAAICAGLYPFLVQVDRQNGCLISEKDSNIHIHHSSVLSFNSVSGSSSAADDSRRTLETFGANWILYEEMTYYQSGPHVRTLTAVPPIAVALTGGACLSQDTTSAGLRLTSDSKESDRKKYLVEGSDSENECDHQKEADDHRSFMKIDDWIAFQGDSQTIRLVSSCRLKLSCLLKHRLCAPSKSMSHSDEAVLRCVISVLCNGESLKGSGAPLTRDDVEQDVGNDQRHSNPTGTSAKLLVRGPLTDQQTLYHGERNRGVAQEEDKSDRTRRIYGQGSFGGLQGSNDSTYYVVKREGKEKTNEIAAVSKEATLRGKRYFIMKCNNEKNLEISFARGIWATTKGNERKLDRAYQSSLEVILIFSIQGSGHFQGFGRMTSEVTNTICQDFASDSLGGIFNVQWLQKRDIAFQHTHHLTNPWNENKKVQVSRDGQELEPSVGERLCQLWELILPGSIDDRENFQQYANRNDTHEYTSYGTATGYHEGYSNKEEIVGMPHDVETFVGSEVPVETCLPSAAEYGAVEYEHQDMRGPGGGHYVRNIHPFVAQTRGRGRHKHPHFQQGPRMEEEFYEEDHSGKGFVFVEGSSAAPYYTAEGQEAAVFTANYNPEFRPLQPQGGYPHPGIYHPMVPAFHAQAAVHTAYRPQEMYAIAPNQYSHFARPLAPEFFPAGVQLIPSPRIPAHGGNSRHVFAVGRTRPINIRGLKP